MSEQHTANPQQKAPLQQKPLQHKTLPVEHFKALDAEQGIAEMIVSVFNNIDYAEDRILPGSFAKSLQRKLPKGVWMHMWHLPVAKTLEAVELLPGDKRLPEKLKTLGGLYVKAQFNLGTERGRDAFSDLQFGTVDEFSIGFITSKEARNDADKCNDLIEIELFEWSPVLVGCNPETTIISAKDMTPAQLAEFKNRWQQLMQPGYKSQFLGEYIEFSMTMAAISRLNDRLMYYAVYDTLLNEQMTLDEKLAYLSNAFDEFRDIALRVVAAILNDTDGAEPVDAATKSLRELWSQPTEEQAAPIVSSGHSTAKYRAKQLARRATAAVLGYSLNTSNSTPTNSPGES